jgi:hypothetical protein
MIPTTNSIAPIVSYTKSEREIIVTNESQLPKPQLKNYALEDNY